MKKITLLTALTLFCVVTMQAQNTFPASGNVGIGTTKPSNDQGWNTVLDVKGNNNAKILVTTNDSSIKTGIFSHAGYGGGFLGTESNHNLHLVTGYTPKLSILTNGNVGIGNTDPSAKLHIAGDFKLVDGTQGAGKILTSDANGKASWQNIPVTTTTWSSNGNNLYNSSAGNVGIGTNTPSTKLHIAGDFKLVDGTQGAGKILTSDANGKASWQNIPVTTTTWSSNGNNLYNSSGGNVGIGTSTPSNDQGWEKVLDVKGNNNAKILVTTNDSSIKTGIFSHAGYGGGFLGTESNHNLHLVTGYTPKLSILTNGNVGIGNTDPSHKLEIIGNDNVAAFSSTGSNAYIRLWANAAGGINERVEFTNRGNGKATIWTPGAGDALVVNRNGNIGIGNSEPSAKLHIAGDFKLVDGTQGAGKILTSDSNGKASWQNIPSIGISATGGWLSNGNNLYNSNTGNVGIGTSTPSNDQGWEKVLDVKGNNNAKILVTTNDSSIKTGIFSHAGFGGGFLGTESNHNLHLVTGYIPKLTILTNGNVGIGTTNPVAKLTVEGNILASSIKVAVPGSANWSDYVFAKEYQLQPLEEVEAFIKKNQHLPNVPSAAEMVKEGNDLGKTDAKLLEKIEELTLYVIEMKKTINSLNNKIQELEKNPKTNNN